MSREIVLPPEHELPAKLELVRRRVIDEGIMDEETADRAIEVVKKLFAEEYAKERAEHSDE